MKNRAKLFWGLILVLTALVLGTIAFGQSALDVGKGDVIRMASWNPTIGKWTAWQLGPTILTAQLSVGKGEVGRMAYWNGTAWAEWLGTIPLTSITAGNWKTFYSNGSGVIQELALPAAYNYLQGNEAAVAPSFTSVLRPTRVTSTAGPDTFESAVVRDSLKVEGNGQLKCGNDTSANDVITIDAFRGMHFYNNSRIYRERVFTFNHGVVTGTGKPTLVSRGVFYGFSLPIYSADNEELFTCNCMPSDWDSTTNFYIYLGGWVTDANASGKRFQMQVSVETANYPGNEIVPTTTNDYTFEITSDGWGAFTSFKGYVTVVAATVQTQHDWPLAIRIRRIAASANEITGEVVIEGCVLVYIANQQGRTLNE